MVEADWEWAEHCKHRWVIIATGRYSFPVHRIRWNHAMVHFDKFYPVSFLFDTIFFLLELVVLMKFFCLRIFCHLTGILRSSAFFVQFALIDSMHEKSLDLFLSLRTQIKQFYFHSFLFCDQNDKRNLKSKLISWNCLIRCRLWCKYPLSFFMNSSICYSPLTFP